MKTNCTTCKKTSINLLHKASGAVFCINCGSKMNLSTNITNSLLRAGLLLPDDFFKDPATQTPPASKKVNSSGRTQIDPKLAAEARRAQMMQHTGTLDGEHDTGRPSFRSKRKISKEEAAQEKAAIRASLVTSNEMYERITENSIPPDIYSDLKAQGFDEDKIEREFDEE